MRHIDSLTELRSLIGQEVAVSEWIGIDQTRVDLFAQASGDFQWIHVDVGRCRQDSPYGAPIAHGFLTLSLLTTLLQSSIAFPPCKLAVNYGLNKVRFPAAVRVGSRVRAHIHLQSLEEMSEALQMTWLLNVECDTEEKPVCVAELILRHYD